MCIDPGIDLNSSPQSRQTNTPKVQHTTNFDGGEKALHLTWVVVTSYIPRYWKLSRTNVDRVKNCVPRVQDRIATTYCHHHFYANRRRSGAHSRRASSRTRSFQTDEWTDGRTEGRRLAELLRLLPLRQRRFSQKLSLWWSQFGGTCLGSNSVSSTNTATKRIVLRVLLSIMDQMWATNTKISSGLL